MSSESNKYHNYIADYFSAQVNFFDGEKQKKPHIRKCMELPYQQTKVEMWDEVANTLCDLDFIQAKACAKQTYDLVNDFNVVLEVIPDNVENIRQERERQARMDKYTKDLIAYAKAEITELEVPETEPLWIKEKINEEIEMMKTNPTRVDRLKDFIKFLGQEARNLQNYAHEFPNFTYQQAWNFADSGHVGESAGKSSQDILNCLLLRRLYNRPSWNPLSQSVKTLKESIDIVSAIAITPDGKWAISGSYDESCVLWKLDTGESIHILKGHTNRINSVSITPDGKRAISGSLDKSCILWDLDTGLSIYHLNGHNDSVEAVAITPDGNRAISGSVDNKCILWDLSVGKKISILKGHYKPVEAVAITPDSKWAISGSEDQTCIFWDLTSGQVVHILEGHSFYISGVAITPDGKKAISCSLDKSCIVWDLNTGQAINRLIGHLNLIYSVALTPDGKRAISGSEDQYCFVWDLLTGEVLRTLIGHSGAVLSVMISPDGQRAYSSSTDKTCLVWNLNAINSSDAKVEYIYPIYDIAVTTDGKKAITASMDSSCNLWNLDSGQLIAKMKGHIHSVKIVSVTPDGRRAISGSTDATFILWDLLTGKAIQKLEGYTSEESLLVISPDGKKAISASINGSWIIWDIETGQVNYKKQKVLGLAITPDGKRIISTTLDFKTIWDMSTGHKIGEFRSPYIKDITHDGKGAISLFTDQTYYYYIWDLRTGRTLHKLDCHTEDITNIAITPDMGKFITSSLDNNCIIWDLEKKKKQGLFIADSRINSISIFPGGIVGAEESGKIFILNVNKNLLNPYRCILTIKQIWDFKLHQYLPFSADCPQCGHRFAPSASILGTIGTITEKAGLKPEQSPCLDLPDEAWEDQGLLGNCPKCGAALKFNPFIAGGDYKPKTNWKFWKR